MDMQLTDDDITLTDDLDLQLVTGPEAVLQHAKMRFRTWLGETLYDISEGTPFIEVIFDPNTPRAAIRLVCERRLRDTPGVTGATMDEPVVSATSRDGTISGRMETIDGDVDFSIDFGVGV